MKINTKFASPANVISIQQKNIHVHQIHTYMYNRVIHHFFKQTQNETAVLNVFQDLKSISEKSDQN